MKEDAFSEAGIPDKFYFKIGEVSEIAGVPPYVLRFWETEFRKIRPKRTAAGQRLYRRQDVLLVLRIKYLLYDRKFTIEGARRHLKHRSGSTEVPGPPSPSATLDIGDIRDELIRIRNLIDDRRS